MNCPDTARNLLKYLNTLIEEELDLEVGIIDGDDLTYSCAWSVGVEDVIDMNKPLKAVVFNYMKGNE
jgi:hypothetical protein